MHRWDLAEPQLKSDHVKKEKKKNPTQERLSRKKMPYSTPINHL